jgi:hypothetical protein
MIEQLLQLIQQHGQEAVVNNPDVPNEHNDAVLKEAGSSIVGGLQQALAGGGGLQQITSLFSGGNNSSLASLTSNPVVQNIIQSFAGKIAGQFNVNSASAQQIGSNLIPQVLSKLGGQVSDPSNSSIDINSVVSTLTGGAGGAGLSGLLNNLGGGGEGGGLTDMLKGFMK